MAQVDWRALLAIGEAALRGRGSCTTNEVLQTLHSAAAGAVAASSGGAVEAPLGAATEALCDCLDRSLIPCVLRWPARDMDDVRCTCRHCVRVARTVQRVRDCRFLEELVVANPFPFLFGVLEQAAAAPMSDQELANALLAAEITCIVGVHLRLRNQGHFHFPADLARELANMLALIPMDGREYSAGAPVLLGALHVFRSVPGNRLEVIEATNDGISKWGHQLWLHLEFSLGRDVVSPRSEGDDTVAQAFIGSALELKYRNPQESDECTPGAEFHPPDPGKGIAGEERCAELFMHYSLTLQALFHGDEALGACSTLEAAIRSGVSRFVVSCSEAGLPRSLRDRFLFQIFRLYMLLSRSSHTRRQYVVLARAAVEEERRVSAALLSLVSPAQRCCELLQGMVQEVQGWLLWQSQASTAGGDVAKAAGSPEGLQAPQPPRQRHRRGARQTSRPRAARTTAGSQRRPSPPPGKALTTKNDSVEEGELFARCLFTSSEAVWAFHAVLVLALVACLIGSWCLLERPQGTFTGPHQRSGA
mmetsp:Transcript_59983/g.120100  ORF Transcript_59983/g.120100 Transcript_59983/m.120100 type:complete len:534 (+) Transcript_59983:1-1602(+)